MLLLFSVMFLLCDFPLFLCYSWFRPDIYMFVHIPVRSFPGVEVVFLLFCRFLVFCSLPYQIQCGICLLHGMLC